MSKQLVKDIIKYNSPLIDFFLVPWILISAIFLKLVRKMGVQRMPLSKSILIRVGVFPIRDHYYEPSFKLSYLKKSLRDDRILPGIDLNISEQLELLSKLMNSIY